MYNAFYKLASAMATNATSTSSNTGGQTISQFQNKSNIQSITKSDNNSSFNSGSKDVANNAALASIEDRTMLNVPIHNAKKSVKVSDAPKKTKIESGSMSNGALSAGSLKVASILDISANLEKIAEAAFNNEIESVINKYGLDKQSVEVDSGRGYRSEY